MTPEQFNALPRTELEKLIGSLPNQRFISLVGPRFYKLIMEMRSRKLMDQYDRLDRCLDADYTTELLANALIARATATAKNGLTPGSPAVP